MMYMKKSRVFLLAATATLTVLLTACMSMPISTMYKMSQFSPLDMEPSEIRVAIRTNEVIDVQNGAVKISMGLASEGLNEDGEKVHPAIDEKYEFQVQVLTDSKADITPILLDGLEERERLTILKLSNEDAKVMADVLALARKYKASNVKINGSFSIGTENSCFGNISQFEELEVDVFLQTDNKEGYMLFIEDIDIIEEAIDRNVDLKAVNQCQADSNGE